MSTSNRAFAIQKKVRGPWRRFLDELNPLRPDLFRYCCKLTGNVWDGEDLAQDTLMRVFTLLGKIDAQLENPKAYLIRTATNLWIDRVRRSVREKEILELDQVDTPIADATSTADAKAAAKDLLQRLHPQERAAVVLKEVLEYSLEETAAVLKTTVGAVKSALHRGRGRLNNRSPSAGFAVPSRELVQTFMDALAAKDLTTLQTICATDLAVEMVGGAESTNFEQSRMFFSHAHTVLPAMGFGLAPRWVLIEHEGEPMVLGLRTLNGREGVNEIHRLEVLDGVVTRVRLYCFCPDVLRAVGAPLGIDAVVRPIPYRSPSMSDVPRLAMRHVLGKMRRK
jgi:RNA polymerase sigma-70 factor (ECF subfamily)